MFLNRRVATLTVGEAGQEGILIKDLRIRFSISKTSESNPNMASIEVFNLSASNRKRLETLGTRPRVVLKVGYVELEPTVVFIGDIIHSYTVKNGADFITTIRSGDADYEIQNSFIDKSYQSGTELRTIVNDLSTAMGVTIGEIKDIGNEQFANGGAISGKVKDVLDNLAKRLGLGWNIQDGELHIKDKNSIDETQAVLVSPSTGLINSPIRQMFSTEFTSLLNPAIKPNKTIYLESKVIEPGFMRVRRVTYTGDTHGSDWYLHAECF